MAWRLDGRHFENCSRRHLLRAGELIDIEIEGFAPPQPAGGAAERLAVMFHQPTPLPRSPRRPSPGFGVPCVPDADTPWHIRLVTRDNNDPPAHLSIHPGWTAGGGEPYLDLRRGGCLDTQLCMITSRRFCIQVVTLSARSAACSGL